MRRCYIISGIFLILPIIDFAVAAPVPGQEEPQAGVDAVREDVETTLVKRGDELDELPQLFKDLYAKPESESSAALPSSSAPPSGPYHGSTDDRQPLPPIPEDWEWLPVASTDHRPPSPPSWIEPGPELMMGGTAAPPGSDPELMDSEIHAPLSSPVIPTWFHPDHRLAGMDAPRPNLGSLNPRPLTEFDSNHRLVVVEPPSRPASPTVSNVDDWHQVVQDDQ